MGAHAQKSITLNLERHYGEGTSTRIAITPATRAGPMRDPYTTTQDYPCSSNEFTSRTRRKKSNPPSHSTKAF